MPCYLSVALTKVSETIAGSNVEALRILGAVLLWRVSSVFAGENFRLCFVLILISDAKVARKDLEVSY